MDTDTSAQLTLEGERHDFDEEVRHLVEALPAPSRPQCYQQILLAYDGSPGARAAIERVAAVASPETVVTVVTVIPFESIGASPDPIKPELREWQWDSLTEASALLEKRGIRAFVEAAAGNPGPVILETARTLGADLVVLGRGHDKWWYPSMKRRSVRRALMRAIQCDGLVVTSREQIAGSPGSGVRIDEAVADAGLCE